MKILFVLPVQQQVHCVSRHTCVQISLQMRAAVGFAPQKSYFLKLQRCPMSERLVKGALDVQPWVRCPHTPSADLLAACGFSV